MRARHLTRPRSFAFSKVARERARPGARQPVGRDRLESRRRESPVDLAREIVRENDGSRDITRLVTREREAEREIRERGEKDGQCWIAG